MKKELFICFFLLFGCLQAIAQQELVTDRPDATESANIMQVGEVQIEAGYSYDKSKSNGVESKISGFGALFRIGLFKQAEFRVETGYVNQDLHDISKVNGIPALTLGTKLNILNDEENGFQLAFLGHLTLPGTGKKEFSPENIASDFRLAIAKDLSERVSMGANVGMEWDGDSPKQSLLYSMASGISIIENLGLFLEIFGFFPKDEDGQHYFNAGATYLVSPDFQVDFGFGTGFTESSSDLIYTIGLSYRIQTKKESN